MRKVTTRYLTKISVLSAIAVLLMFLETPIFFMPAFLKLDLSEIPALLGAFAMGPLAGVFIELIKNIIHLTNSQTLGIGELANFLVGISYVGPAGFIYNYNKTKLGALKALFISTLSMVFTASILNYFFLLPLYQTALHFPLDAMIAIGQATNPLIIDIKSLITFGIAPFNLIKGIILSFLTLIIYKKISYLLHH